MRGFRLIDKCMPMDLATNHATYRIFKIPSFRLPPAITIGRHAELQLHYL